MGLGGHLAVAELEPPRPVPLPDPVCRATNSTVASVTALPAVSEGTRRMAARLARIREAADPARMFYLNDRVIPRLQQQLASERDPVRRAQLQFQLGRQWVWAGDPARGVDEFERLNALLAGPGAAAGAVGASDMRLQLAVAYLRLGEQQNCVDRHGVDSCLLPIRGDGIHRLPTGSRGAIRVLSEQLALAPGDLRARWLLNIAAMTLGEWPDRVPEPWRIPASVFESEDDIGRFYDIAPALGLDVNDLAGGCVVDDFDNDGFLDVAVSSWALDGPLHLFRNLGDGRFVDRAREAGLTGMVGGLNLQQTDYNNDGHLDLWVLRGAWFGTAGRIPNSLLRNNGDGTFSDVTEEAGLLSFHPTQASAWFDFDGDGWLDVFIGNETRDPRDPDECELYRNNGDGTFTECAAQAGLSVVAWVKGVTAGDYDNDGRPDLYLSCLDGANLLFRNEGPRGGPGAGAGGRLGWKFRNVTREAGIDETIHSFPTWFFDYDNDGWEDLFVSGYHIRDVGDIAADYLGQRHAAARPRLYRNLGNGRFTNVTASVRLDRVCQTMGCNFGDLDNDGWLDFYLATGDPDLATIVPNRMFRNDGGRRFLEITTSGGFGHLQKGHAVAFADLDNDGDQDVYTVLGGAYQGDRYPNVLFHNPGHGRRWIRIHCTGSPSNRAAVGARLRVIVESGQGRRVLHRTLNSGGSFGSSPLRREIGLGVARGTVDVEIDWPGSGQRQVFRGLKTDRSYRLREGDSEAIEWDVRRVDFHATRAGVR